MAKKGRMGELISEGMIALVGLFILFTLTKEFCSIDSGFCLYGWKIFGILFIVAYFLIKYGIKK